MVIGLGLMNIGRISVNQTITTLEIVPNNLVCDGYAYFIVDVERVDMITPDPIGIIRIINVDTGEITVSGSLVDGYVVLSKQLSNGVYNFAAAYNGIINSFAPSQSVNIGYNVNFIETDIRITGPLSFRSSVGAEYIVGVNSLVTPNHSINGFVIFTANDGYQITTIDIVPLVNNQATLEIEGGEFDVGNWIIAAQFISDGVCYASSNTDSLNVEVTF